MKLTLTRAYDGAVLTTHSSASCYGVPVLRIDGRDYGPADIVPIDPQRPTLHHELARVSLLAS
ncbi:MAG TPA: hypothetical protein VI756_17410 [Blastocatellia bacterium]